jgi:uncharacterized membrane protein SirB2
MNTLYIPAVVWVHIVSMVLGFAALISHDAMLLLSSRSKSAGFVRLALRASAPAGLFGKLLIVTGVLSGLYLAAPFGYGATWLIGSYALVALAVALGAAFIDPFRKRVARAAAAGDVEIDELRTGSLPLAVTYINTICWAGAIWLMVAKPSL